MTCCMCKRYIWDDPPETFYRDPSDGREYCLFHAPVEKKEHRTDFNYQLKLYLKKRMQDAKRPWCNLCGTIFPNDIRFDEDFKDVVFPGVNLSDSVFMGEIQAFEYQFEHQLIFGDVIFHDEVYFNKIHFKRRVSFLGSKFKKRVSLDESTFDNGLIFGGAHCEQTLSFNKSKFAKSLLLLGITVEQFASFNKSKIEKAIISNSKFESQADFRGTCIGKAEFKRTSFRDNTDFTGLRVYNGSNFNDSNFNGGVYFHSALLGGGASFERTRFKDYLSFDRTRFYGKTSFKGAFFAEPCHFGRSHFTHPISFEACSTKHAIVMDRVNMHNVHLFNSPIEAFNFTCCDWQTQNGHQIVSDHNQLAPSQLEDIYRRLKKSAKQNNDELVASQWHWQEKEMCLQSLKDKNFPTLREWFLRVILKVYKRISGYGEEPLQAFAWLFLLWLSPLLIFSLMKFIETGGYRPTSLDMNEVNNALSAWFQCMPLKKISTSSPLTQQWICWLSQVFLTLQAALFGFSLRNKLRR